MSLDPFQFTHYNNDSNGRGVQTEEKLHNVDRLEAKERTSTKTERKWKFVAHLEKSKFFMFSLKTFNIAIEFYLCNFRAS